MSFSGAKLALFVGEDLLTILRDDYAGIPYPGHWDLPGGGREGNETPEACILRETKEEVGLVLKPSDLIYAQSYQRAHRVVWFYAAHLPATANNNIIFGSEGQTWQLMSDIAFLGHPMAVPHFKDYLQDYLTHSHP